MQETLSTIHATPAFVLRLATAALCRGTGWGWALLWRLVLWGVLVMGSVPVLAQPMGCTSTYTISGTAAGRSAGLFGEYYLGTFQMQSGYSEASQNTFFDPYASFDPG
jgi:hypothetical protein